MGYIHIIKQGIARANRNWPLLLVQFVAGVLTVLAAFFLVGIPVIIGIVMVGVDVSQMGDIERFFEGMNPADILSRYLGVAVVVAVGVLVYIIFAVCFSIYVQAGVVASVGRSVMKRAYEFSLKVFFKDAKRFFKPVLIYNILLFFILLALVGLAVLAVLAMSIGGVFAVGAGAGGGKFGVFMKWLVGLTSVFVFILAFAGFVGLSVQGMAPLILRGQRPLKAIQNAMGFWERDRRALWLLAIVIGGMIAIQFLAALLGTGIQLIPIFGPLINLPYQFLTNILGMYLYIVVISIVFYYYVARHARKKPAAAIRRSGSSSGGGSSSPGSTSAPAGDVPRPLPPPTAPQE